jgi:hemin uptake protein HemP
MTRHNTAPPKTAVATSSTTRCDDASLSGRRHLDSADLFQGARELVITHNGEAYCLRVTRNEKLILTK